MTQTARTISVIICAYNADRWDELVAAIQSVQQQTLAPLEIILAIDHNPALLERVQRQVPGVVVVENTGARNSGIAAAGGEIIAFLYQPLASVLHRVPRHRACWRYFCARCYGEGFSKAVVTRYVGAKDSLAPEHKYALRTLPLGVLRGLSRALFHGDPAGLARAGAITAGLAITATGYLLGRISLQNVNSEHMSRPTGRLVGHQQGKSAR